MAPTRPAALPVDFALITALEEERDALLAHLPDARALEKDAGDAITVYAAEIATTRADRAVYRVLVTCLSAMGPIAAAVRALGIAHRFRPRGALMVGIAGGVSGEVELGDVVVADQIADYTLGKDTGGGRAARWKVHPADPGLLDSAVHLATGWEASIQAPPLPPGRPRRHVGVVASGGDVIATAARIAEIRATWPKLVGVEMEGGGVATALASAPERPPFLMIRGVSDLADEAKDAPTTRAFRAFAGHAAAAYAIALLRSGPIPPGRAAGRPLAGADPAARAKRLLQSIRERLSLDELVMLVLEAFPEIPGGLSGIVAPTHDFRYQTAQVVDYFRRRRQIDLLEIAVEQALGTHGEDVE